MENRGLKELCCGKGCEVRGTCARYTEKVGGYDGRVNVMICCIGGGLYVEARGEALATDVASTGAVGLGIKS